MKRRCTTWEDVEQLAGVESSLQSELERVESEMEYLAAQAEDLEESIERTQEEHTAALNSYTSYVFQENCKRLRKNDSECTTVELPHSETLS
jgi:predicted  nucleic acid-binding Zn-ribbon protein